MDLCEDTKLYIDFLIFLITCTLVMKFILIFIRKLNAIYMQTIGVQVTIQLFKYFVLSEVFIMTVVFSESDHIIVFEMKVLGSLLVT